METPWAGTFQAERIVWTKAERGNECDGKLETQQNPIQAMMELQALTVWIRTFTLHLISRAVRQATWLSLLHLAIAFCTSLHSDRKYTPMDRLPKVLCIPLEGNNVHTKFSDTVGTGVKTSIVHCYHESAFQFNLLELLFAQHSGRHGEKREK